MRKTLNWTFVLRVISKNLLIISIALLLNTLIAFIYQEDPLPFIYSCMVAVFIILVISLVTGKKDFQKDTMYRREAYLVVTFSWISISLIGMLPFLFSGSIPDITNALFESVSGFTTTGSSILTDIEALPKSILFWRSLTHWIGGIGIIVLVVIIMPSLRMGGYQMFTLESSLQDKIKPTIKSVGRRLVFIYLLLTFSEVALLYFGGMNLFESVCHAFGTISTGGFSPKNTSITDYAPYFQYVIMLFMFLSGTNFIIHYYLLKRKPEKIKENEEFKFYTLVVAFFGFLITFILFFKMDISFEQAFRDAFFQVISVITCTGFATADYLKWPEYAWIIIFFIMFLGGSTGSTSGGIKMARYLVLLKSLNRTFKALINPNAVLRIRLNRNIITDDSVKSIMTFMAVYLLFFFIAGILLVAQDLDIPTSFSAVATCMAGIGPGLGKVGPASNFASLPALAKNILSFVMITGRLEIYTIVMLFSKDFWLV